MLLYYFHTEKRDSVTVDTRGTWCEDHQAAIRLAQIVVDTYEIADPYFSILVISERGEELGRYAISGLDPEGLPVRIEEPEMPLTDHPVRHLRVISDLHTFLTREHQAGTRVAQLQDFVRRLRGRENSHGTQSNPALDGPEGLIH